MQRRAFLKKAGLGAVAGTAAVAAPAIAQSNPQINWKMTSTYGPSLPPLFSTAQMFCDLVTPPLLKTICRCCCCCCSAKAHCRLLRSPGVAWQGLTPASMLHLARECRSNADSSICSRTW